MGAGITAGWQEKTDSIGLDFIFRSYNLPANKDARDFFAKNLWKMDVEFMDPQQVDYILRLTWQHPYTHLGQSRNIVEKAHHLLTDFIWLTEHYFNDYLDS